MNFLPENYEAPKASGYYMKLQEGENKIRILSKPVLGWEDWQDKKPVRFAFNNKPLKSIDDTKPVKHFWAMIVWNYNEEQIQILQITQATLRTSLEALCKDSDWGAPYFYDLKIIKSGEGKETQYRVNPLPHKPTSAHIIQKFNERRCNLDALFSAEDPFAKAYDVYTGGIFEREEVVALTKEATISQLEVIGLESILSECNPLYKAQLMDNLSKLPIPIGSLNQIPTNLFQRIKSAAMKKRDEFQALMSEEAFA